MGLVHILPESLAGYQKATPNQDFAWPAIWTLTGFMIVLLINQILKLCSPVAVKDDGFERVPAEDIEDSDKDKFFLLPSTTKLKRSAS